MKLPFFFLFVFFFLPSLSFAQEEKAYHCYRFTKEPVLDGIVTGDPAWKDVAPATGFVKLGSDSPAVKQTFFKIGYTPEALYIGIECEEPEVETIHAKCKDGDVNICQEDSVEIFLFPPGADNYYQFMINAIGSRWNGIGVDSSFLIPLGDWQATTYSGKEFWSVEIKIPFEIFLIIPEKGEEWTGNICRNIITSGDRYSSWALLGKGFHEPGNFGKIVFKREISSGEGKETKKRIVHSIKEKILINLTPIWASEKEFLEASKRYSSLQKELADFLEECKGIKNAFSQLDDFSVKESNLLLKKSQNLSAQFNILKGKVLKGILFD